MKNLYRKILIVTLFAIAMGLLESAVVIYLREIMYPEGFNFPLRPVHPNLALTEILREAATMVMLICIGLLAGKTFSVRFAWFMYSFAIWDIFYYVFLRLLIGWPESLMTWDVLFLIPATWTGPVLCPLILTGIMILFSGIIILYAERNIPTKISAIEWTGLCLGSCILITAFISDYMKHMLSEFKLAELMKPGNPDILTHAESYLPANFPWPLFLVGVAILLASVAHYGWRIRQLKALF